MRSYNAFLAAWLFDRVRAGQCDIRTMVRALRNEGSLRGKTCITFTNKAVCQQVLPCNREMCPQIPHIHYTSLSPSIMLGTECKAPHRAEWQPHITNETQSCIKSLNGHEKGIKCLKLLDENKLASGSFQEIKIWNINDGNCLKTLLKQPNNF